MFIYSLKQLGWEEYYKEEFYNEEDNSSLKDASTFIEDGLIDEKRFESYVTLQKEIHIDHKYRGL